MNHPPLIHRPLFVSLALPCLVAAWWGCAKGSDNHATGGSTSSSSVSSGSGGTGGTGGSSSFDGGGGEEAGVCVSTSVTAHHVPLDIVFLIDQSGSMHGPKWMTVTTALTKFFSDPASANIGAGMLFFPYSAWDCNLEDYKTLSVPLAALPANAFNLTNAIPADAVGIGTPMYPALQGALMQATAYQDANSTHKVIVVLATDGDPDGCDGSITDIAGLATGALNYNGVHTFVIGVPGATIANLNMIAAGGGTMAAYDVTNDITQFAAKIAEIRTVGLGCDFGIPPPPGSMMLDPNEVNFSYTPKGMGAPVTLLRAQNLADCNGQPGWYYDSNTAPTKIVLCPASCTTVQADDMAQVNVLFGCHSLLK